MPGLALEQHELGLFQPLRGDREGLRPAETDAFLLDAAFGRLGSRLYTSKLVKDSLRDP